MALGNYLIMDGPGVFDLICSLFNGDTVRFKTLEAGDGELKTNHRGWRVVIRHLTVEDREERIYTIAGETQTMEQSKIPSSKSAFYSFKGKYDARKRTGLITIGSTD